MPDHRLIVGLDVPDTDAARALVERLGDSVGFYKVGLGLAPRRRPRPRPRPQGRRQARLPRPQALRHRRHGRPPPCAPSRPLAPDFLTVHGDPHVVRAAVAGRGDAPTRILAVTVLTSLDRDDLDDAPDRCRQRPDLVVERARRAFAAGADGVIASPARGRPPRAPCPRPPAG